MSAKTVFSTALVVTLCTFGAVRAQAPKYPQDDWMPKAPLDSGKPPPDGLYGKGPATQPSGWDTTAQHPLSSWIRGDKFACCDEVGCCGPIQEELFFRLGPALPVGNGTVVDNLQTGLYLGIGGRVLFFDPAMTSAWTVELGLAHIYNHAHFPANGQGIPLNILVPQDPNNPVTPRDANGNLPPQPVSFGQGALPGVTLTELDRTYLDLGVGKEWYLFGSASNCDGCRWRVGCDGGGRWGSEMASFNEIRHRTDVIGGVWAAIHTDAEIPCGCCILQLGFRLEYGYTWSDIMQIQNKSDVQDINFLFNIGVRF
jgi:hypothetical protein